MGEQAKCGIVLQAPTSTQQSEKVPSPWWACHLHLAPGSLPCGTYRQHSDVKVHHTITDTSSPAGQLARGQALPWAANRRQAVNPTGTEAGRDVGHCHCNFAAEDAHTCPALAQSQFNSLPYSLVKENKAVKGVRRGPLGLATPVHHLLQAREPLVRAGDQGGVGREKHAVLGATLQQKTADARQESSIAKVGLACQPQAECSAGTVAKTEGKQFTSAGATEGAASRSKPMDSLGTRHTGQEICCIANRFSCDTAHGRRTTVSSTAGTVQLAHRHASRQAIALAGAQIGVGTPPPG